MTTLDTSPGGGTRSRPGAPSAPSTAAAPAVAPATARTRASTAATTQDAARTRLPARRTTVPPSGPVTGPGIGRRLRRMRIGGTPYPELQNAAAALEALSGRPAPEPDPDLPDPTAQVCRVVRAAVEVLRGERPAAQLARWVTPQVYDQLLERGRLMREARQVLPPRPKAHPAAVRRVRMVRLGATSAEATVILHDEGRVRAAAVRLEARRGVWRVAVLEIG
ncbi:Rv3235 family protein [Promicromonospora sukumoe]|uniref:Rv3235 family protein n=1 Tax=Promicromonospora sukumoe TaxID=88382 RepID=UPI0003A32D2C|nr:Rv3235 family protein [Promicromonospora sukumoe]